VLEKGHGVGNRATANTRYSPILLDRGAASVALDEREDEALMLAYSQGDAAAFEMLLKRHQRPVYNFFVRQVGNTALAEDLMQEVFLRVIKSAASYKRQAKFTTWLYTIARNLCVDHARRARLRRASSLDQPLGNPGSERGRTLGDLAADPKPGVERQVTSKRLKDDIQRAIETLSEEQREVFLMRETLNLPFKEIAQIVECPENTVKSRMRYALEQLRKALEDYRDVAHAAQ
jgi:RNA polymerase sigma-70 factor (ECF subfamily)